MNWTWKAILKDDRIITEDDVQTMTKIENEDVVVVEIICNDAFYYRHFLEEGEIPFFFRRNQITHDMNTGETTEPEVIATCFGVKRNDERQFYRWFMPSGEIFETVHDLE